MITGDGKSISVTVYNGIKNNASPRYDWPKHPKPNQKIWGKWQADLHSNYSLMRNLTLTKQSKLGKWLHLGSTGWVYYPSQYHILKETTRVDSLSPTLTKIR